MIRKLCSVETAALSRHRQRRVIGKMSFFAKRIEEESQLVQSDAIVFVYLRRVETTCL